MRRAYHNRMYVAAEHIRIDGIDRRDLDVIRCTRFRDDELDPTDGHFPWREVNAQGRERAIEISAEGRCEIIDQSLCGSARADRLDYRIRKMRFHALETVDHIRVIRQENIRQWLFQGLSVFNELLDI